MSTAEQIGAARLGLEDAEVVGGVLLGVDRSPGDHDQPTPEEAGESARSPADGSRRA